MAGHRLGALEGGGIPAPPPSNTSLGLSTLNRVRDARRRDEGVCLGLHRAVVLQGCVREGPRARGAAAVGTALSAQTALNMGPSAEGEVRWRGHGAGDGCGG